MNLPSAVSMATNIISLSFKLSIFISAVAAGDESLEDILASANIGATTQRLGWVRVK